MNIQRIPKNDEVLRALVPTARYITESANRSSVHMPNPNRTLQFATVELSAEGLRNLEVGKAFSATLNDIKASGENSGNRVQDLAIAFGRVYHLFNPPPEESSVPVFDVANFTAGQVFRAGDVFSYDNRYWEVLQDFTHHGDPNWRPGLAHSLFRERPEIAPKQQYCPILHNAFRGMVGMAFGVEATAEFSRPEWIYEFELCENDEIILNWIKAQPSVEVREAWEQSQPNAGTFVDEFLRHVYTRGHEFAFNTAIALVS